MLVNVIHSRGLVLEVADWVAAVLMVPVVVLLRLLPWFEPALMHSLEGMAVAYHLLLRVHSSVRHAQARVAVVLTLRRVLAMVLVELLSGIVIYLVDEHLAVAGSLGTSHVLVLYSLLLIVWIPVLLKVHGFAFMSRIVVGDVVAMRLYLWLALWRFHEAVVVCRGSRLLILVGWRYLLVRTA